MIPALARGAAYALLATLLGCLPLGAAELRMTTLFRTGSVTNVNGYANVVVADVLGDSRPEIVSCSNGSAFAMSHDGTSYRTTWYSPPVLCTGVAVGDRDGNGSKEVFVATAGQSYSNTAGAVYVFDPTSYGPEVAKLVTGTEMLIDIAIGNVDGDAALEIVALTGTKAYVLNAATLSQEWVASYGGHTVAIADLENNGMNEIVIAGGNVDVLDASTQTYKWGFPASNVSMVVGDVDNDGKAEIVVGAPEENVRIINGDTMITASLTLRARPIATGDANLDGQTELIVEPAAPGAVEGYNAAGSRIWAIASPRSAVRGIAVGDPDNDGMNEVVWATTDHGLLVGNAVSQVVELNATSLDGPFRVMVADLEGDGDLEMILSARSAEFGSRGGAVYVLDYATRRPIGMLPLPPSCRVYEVRVGQVDGDAAREIVVLGLDVYTGYIHSYDGATLAKEWSSTSSQPSTYGLIVRNIDADPVDEIIYPTTDKKIQVLNGAGNVTQFTTPPLDGAIYDLDIADMDGDSVLDLGAGTAYGLYIFRTSDFAEVRHIALEPSFDYRSIALAPGRFAFSTGYGGLAVYSAATFAQEWICDGFGVDHRGDFAFVTLGGQQRLAVALETKGSLRLFPAGGAACPAYDTISAPLYGEGPVDIEFVDLDGDGRPELLGGGNYNASIAVVGLATEPRGDADSDGLVTDADMEALAAFLYGNAAATQPAADVNADGGIRPDDLFYLINYRRGTGAPPPQ
jgi:FG-GAP repeat